MKKNIFAVVFLLCTACCFVFAQDATVSASARELALKEKSAMDKQISAVHQRIFDIEARYWAFTIKETKSPTMEELEDASSSWIGEPAQNQKLIAKIKELLKTDNISPLTPEEFGEMNTALKEISAIAAPGSKDEALKKMLSKKECVRLSARYWAPLVIDGREASLQDIEDFYTNKSYSTSVLKQTKKLIKAKNNKSLSKEELYKLDACNDKFPTR